MSASLVKAPSSSVAPVARCQNLLYFEDLDTILMAILLAKDKFARQQAQKIADNAHLEVRSGLQFVWSRVGDEPEIILQSFADLTRLIEAIFEEYDDPNFTAEELLKAEIQKLPEALSIDLLAEFEKLPKTHAADVDIDKFSTLQLEGLWIEFPFAINSKPTKFTSKKIKDAKTETNSSPSKPKFEITVSIPLPNQANKTESVKKIGPFSINRIHLKFGDIQRDLPARQNH